jgi:hypothetical protein
MKILRERRKKKKKTPKNRVQRAFWDIKTITTFIDLLIIYLKCITTITMDDTIEHFIYYYFAKIQDHNSWLNARFFIHILPRN